MNKRIVVGTNSLSESQYPAYSNHCQFWFNCGRKFPEYDFIFSNPARMGIDQMRNMTAKVAIEQDAEYLVFLDDDVLVPMDGLQKLINCGTDIAAGNVCLRGYPFDYMFFYRLRVEKQAVRPFKELPVGYDIITDENCGLAAVGFSFCLIKVSLLAKLRPPWFITTTNCTEDVYFCFKAKELFPEITLAVDTTVRCGHILWPEVLSQDNRAAYKEYYKKMYGIQPEKPPMERAVKNQKQDLREFIDKMKVG